MLSREFRPTVPEPSSVEMLYAQQKWREAYDRGEQTPQEVLDIWERKDTVGHEYGIFMRSDTKEIIHKMLPDEQPLSLEKMMDMLHVYFWWRLDESEPVDCLELFLSDLSDERFEEAVNVIHAEFSDRCYKQQQDYDSENERCEIEEGMKCFRWYVALNKSQERIESTLQSPSERADELIGMFDEAIHGNEDGYGESPYELNEYDIEPEEKIFVFNREPDTHNLRLMLSRHAVSRLVEAGVDDIEAMDAAAVLEIEKDLRRQGGYNEERYKAYCLFRDKGGNLEEFLQVLERSIAKDDEYLESLLEDFDSPETNLNEMTKKARRELARRYIAENRDEIELLETMYLLINEGISPFYRRRMAEDLFSPELRE